MSKENDLAIIAELQKTIDRLKEENQFGPIERRFDLPFGEEEDWCKCEVCGAYNDVSPCEMCVDEGYVVFDEDGDWKQVKQWMKG